MKIKLSSINMSEEEKIYLLLRDYKEELDKQNTAEQCFKDSPINDREQLFSSFQKWLNLFCSNQKRMVEVVKIYSFETARSLNNKVENYRNNSKRLLKESYWCKYKDVLGKEELNEHTKKMLSHQMELGGLTEGVVNIAFVVASDTLRHVGIEMAGKKNEEFRALENIMKNQLAPIKEELRQVLGRKSYTEALLLENLTREFYRNKGYEVIEADANTDKIFKTDLIAKKGVEVLIAQVKRGQVSRQETQSIARFGSELINKCYNNYQKRIITIISGQFPEDFSEVRKELGESKGINLEYLPISEISKKLKRAGCTT